MSYYLRHAHLFSKLYVLSAWIMAIVWSLGPLLISPKMGLDKQVTNHVENISGNYSNETWVNELSRTILGANGTPPSYSKDVERIARSSFGVDFEHSNSGDINAQYSQERKQAGTGEERAVEISTLGHNRAKNNREIDPAEEYPLFVYAKQNPPLDEKIMKNHGDDVISASEARSVKTDGNPSSNPLVVEETTSQKRVDLSLDGSRFGIASTTVPSETDIFNERNNVGVRTPSQRDERQDSSSLKSSKKYSSLDQRPIMPINVWTGEYSYVNSPW